MPPPTVLPGTIGSQPPGEVLDARCAETLRTILSNVDAPLVVPRLAATVMLVRPDTASGIAVYMTRRSARSTFVPDAYVFPGGAVDPEDREIVAAGGLHGSAGAVAPELAAAAIRELFEEAGILLARDRNGAAASPDVETSGSEEHDSTSSSQNTGSSPMRARCFTTRIGSRRSRNRAVSTRTSSSHVRLRIRSRRPMPWKFMTAFGSRRRRRWRAAIVAR
jgi:8-oxo-dGTP pyrophosphatase MutT (NUDIX family)